MNNNTAELREMINKRTVDNSADFESKNKLTARQRMDILFDEGTFVEIGSFIGDGDETSVDNYSSVITGYGSVGGNLVFAFSQDFSRTLGSITSSHVKKLLKITELAKSKKAPLIGVFDSAGMQIDKGISPVYKMGKAIAELSDAKSVIPTIAVITGACGGISAVLASEFTFKILSNENGSIYISPKTALSDKTISSPENTFKSGAVDILATDDTSACKEAVKLCKYLLNSIKSNDNANRLTDESIVNDYDVYTVINSISDNGTFFEFGKEHAKSIVTGLTLINGVVTAVVATNPAAHDGKTCACGLEKASKFINKLNLQSNKIPLVTLVNTKGLNYGDKPESKGYAEKLSDLASAYVKYSSKECSVTVVINEAYGTAYTVLGSKALGTTINFATDNSKIGVINPVTAVEFLSEVKDETKVEEYASKWAETNASTLEAARLGYIDDIIAPSELRQRIAAAIMMFMA